MLIKPDKQMLEICGSLSYHDGARAWNTLRLKKNILNEFSALKDRNSKVSYKMVYGNSFGELVGIMKNIKDNSGVLPILLFFEK